MKLSNEKKIYISQSKQKDYTTRIKQMRKVNNF
jgi:hypothetical protein